MSGSCWRLFLFTGRFKRCLLGVDWGRVYSRYLWYQLVQWPAVYCTRGLYQHQGGLLSWHAKVETSQSQGRWDKISTNQSINRSNNGSINQSINQLINQSINQSVSKSINQSISQSVSQSVSQLINQIIRQTDWRAKIYSPSKRCALSCLVLSRNFQGALNRTDFQLHTHFSFLLVRKPMSGCNKVPAVGRDVQEMHSRVFSPWRRYHTL